MRGDITFAEPTDRKAHDMERGLDLINMNYSIRYNNMTYLRTFVRRYLHSYLRTYIIVVRNDVKWCEELYFHMQIVADCIYG